MAKNNLKKDLYVNQTKKTKSPKLGPKSKHVKLYKGQGK